MAGIIKRKQAEETILNLNESLEQRVSERTAELTKSNEELQKSETSLSEAQRIAKLGNWDWDIVNNRLHLSDEAYRIFEVIPDKIDATFEAFINAVHPGDREFVQKSVDESLFENKPYNIDYRIVLSDGSTRIVHGQAKVLFDGPGKAIYMKGTVQDITERKRIENSAKVTYKMASLGQMTAGVFHEILNPINIISFHIQLLLVEAEKGSKTEEDLKSIQEEIKRIVKITGDLLVFSRSGKEQNEEIETNSFLEKVISIVEPEMKLSNIKFIRKFEEELPEIMANSDKLRQVFLNLIKNAGDAMPEGGNLTISTQRIEKLGKPFVNVKFKDTGSGIKTKDIDKVFDPFFTTKKEGKGTGLGLSISYGIIKNHGGLITVNSKEGKGTTFIIDLPAMI